MLNLSPKQSGLTLIELLVGMAVGLIVVGAIMASYINTLRISSGTIQSSRLNQEMNAIMNIMANDIRRAGYWGGSIDAVATNPFSQIGSTALEVHTWDGTTDTDTGFQGNGNCIVYSYDLDMDGIRDTTGPNEGFGFRWEASGEPIEMKRGHTEVNDCSDTGETWGPMTDTTFINIQSLTFNLADTKCLNTVEPDRADRNSDGTVDEFDERDCFNAAYPAATGDEVVLIREVLITLTANLVAEPETISSLTQTVQVRNNLIRVTP